MRCGAIRRSLCRGAGPPSPHSRSSGAERRGRADSRDGSAIGPMAARESRDQDGAPFHPNPMMRSDGRRSLGNANRRLTELACAQLARDARSARENTACGNVEIHRTDSHIPTKHNQGEIWYRAIDLTGDSRFIEGPGTEDWFSTRWRADGRGRPSSPADRRRGPRPSRRERRRRPPAARVREHRHPAAAAAPRTAR